MMNRARAASLACLVSVGLLAASPAMAQGMHDMAAMGGKNDNMHMMPATVIKADKKTGLLDVMSEGMALKLHFHAEALAGIKPGDKITLHLGFSKP